MAITSDVNITVNGNKSTLSSPVYFYLGDGTCTLLLHITKIGINMNTYAPVTNIVDEFGAMFARVCILKPDSSVLISKDINEIYNGTIVFNVTKDLMDEVAEEGEFFLQIHLYDNNIFTNPKEPVNRYTIPPVSFNVVKPLCDIGHDKYDTSFVLEAGSAHVDSAIIRETKELKVFDENGIYNKYDWKTGDAINAEDLNRIEAGIWWNSYYGNLVVNTPEDLVEIADDFLVEGMDCYVKSMKECYFYVYNDELELYEWQARETSFQHLLADYIKIDKLIAAKEELQNEIDTVETELDNKINATKTELEEELQTHTEYAEATYATKVSLDETNSDLSELNSKVDNHTEYAEATYATKVSLNETNDNLATLNSKVDNHTEYAEATYAKKEDIPTKVSQLENDKNYVTEEELEVREYLPKYQGVTLLKDAVDIVLSRDTQQYLVLNGEDVSITLPMEDVNQVGEVYEIHLYITITDVEPPVITFNRVTQWNQLPEFEKNTTYEFIFTWLGSRGYWLGGYIGYSEMI